VQVFGSWSLFRDVNPLDSPRGLASEGTVVDVRSVVVAVAVVVIGAAACSSPPVIKVARGTLPAGTAELSVDGKPTRVTDAVRCDTTDWLTTIKTGDEASGVIVMVSNANKLVAEFVRFRNFDGFTGSYDRHLQGGAAVAMTGPTYRIAGTAVGYAGAKAIDRTTEPFELRISC
jgi:ipoprotein LpqH